MAPSFMLVPYCQLCILVYWCSLVVASPQETPRSILKKRRQMPDGTPGPVSMSETPVHFNQVTTSETPKVEERKEVKVCKEIILD